jgi:hypothetical protein
MKRATKPSAIFTPSEDCNTQRGRLTSPVFLQALSRIKVLRFQVHRSTKSKGTLTVLCDVAAK